MEKGYVKTVLQLKNCGFISRSGAPDAFFHRSDLVDLDFGEELREMHVSFDVVDAPKGPRAVNIRPA